MGDMKEGSNGSKKVQIMEIDASSSEFSEKEAVVVNPGEPSETETMEDSGFEPTVKEHVVVTPGEPTDAKRMEASGFEPTVKEPLPSNEKNEAIQIQVQSEIKDSKLHSTKRIFKEISSSANKMATENLHFLKKLLLDITDPALESSTNNNNPASTENLSTVPLDNKSTSSEMQSLDISEPSTSSKPSKNEASWPKSTAKDPRVSHGIVSPVLGEENSKELFTNGGRYYSAKTEKAYTHYRKISKAFKEVENPRCLHVNTYKRCLGLKYFAFPLFHILSKDILDLLDFFNGKDSFKEPKNVKSSITTFQHEEWLLQFIRPHFQIGPQQMEANILKQLKIEFDKLVLEKLFSPESNYQLDENFFKARDTQEGKLRLEYEFEPYVLEVGLHLVPGYIECFSKKSKDCFFNACDCVTSLLKHINESRNQSVEIDAARLTMDIFWMLRKLEKMRTTLIRLLQLEAKKSKGTGYILRVKLHTVIFFNALLIKYTKRIKRFGSNARGLLKLLS